MAITAPGLTPSNLEYAVSDTTAQTAPRAAAEWWATQLADPAFRNERPGEGDFNSFAASGLAAILAYGHPVSAEQLATFTDALEHILIRDTRDDGWHYGLHTDYHPDRSLNEAAETAGIDESRFPWKTNMWIRDGAVTVSAGYAAPHRLVWAPPGWVRPPCGEIRAEEVRHYEYTYFPESCTRPMYHEEEHGDWQPDPVTCGHCGKTRADHYNGTFEDFGHAFTEAASHA